MLRNVQPNAILVKSILIRIKPLQVPATTPRRLFIIATTTITTAITTTGTGTDTGSDAGIITTLTVHRSILLMPEDDTFAGSTLPIPFATLRTLRFLLVTLIILLSASTT